MTLPIILLALGMGALISIYLPMITRTAQILGSAPMANVPFFLIAFVSSVAIAVAAGARGADFARIAALPPILLTAGIMSAAMIIGTSIAIPRLGLGAFFVLMVSGQILAGLIFGQLGLFGIAASDLTLGKVAGAALVIAGVTLVTYR